MSILYRFLISSAWQRDKNIVDKLTYGKKNPGSWWLLTNQGFVVHLPKREVQDGEEHLISIVLHVDWEKQLIINQSHQYWDYWVSLWSLRRSRCLSRQWRKSRWGAADWGSSLLMAARTFFNSRGTLKSPLWPAASHLVQVTDHR